MTDMNGSWVAVTKIDSLVDFAATPVFAGSHRLLLVRIADKVHAIANRCSHADAGLDCGMVRQGWIACPAHGARFDLQTGEPLNPPASAPIGVFPVRIRDNEVEVLVPTA